MTCPHCGSYVPATTSQPHTCPAVRLGSLAEQPATEETREGRAFAPDDGKTRPLANTPDANRGKNRSTSQPSRADSLNESRGTSSGARTLSDRALGNAVVPQVAEFVGRQLLQAVAA